MVTELTIEGREKRVVLWEEMACHPNPKPVSRSLCFEPNNKVLEPLEPVGTEASGAITGDG